jgi:MoaA/NifB/PqqE/SkfB family radical SAM enzyme
MNLRNLSKPTVFSEAWAARPGTFYLLRLLNGHSPCPLPLNIGLTLTFRCNLACDTCLNLQKDSADILAAYREPELSPAEWKDILKNASGRFFKPNVHLRGGEPGLYQGYLDVMAFIKQRGMRCSFTTNGTFLRRDAADIVSTGIDFIQVSLDGPREIHDSIRGAGVFDQAVRAIRAINAARQAQGKSVPRILLNCVVSAHNAAHFSSLIDLARSLHVQHVVFLYFYFPDSEIGQHDIDVAGVKAEMARAINKAAEHDVRLEFYPPLRLDQIAAYYLQPNNPLGRGCISPWLRIMLMPNGKAIACRDHTVGDLKADGVTLKDVWNGDKFLAFRRELAKSKLFPDCGRCCRKQY